MGVGRDCSITALSDNNALFPDSHHTILVETNNESNVGYLFPDRAPVMELFIVL